MLQILVLNKRGPSLGWASKANLPGFIQLLSWMGEGKEHGQGTQMPQGINELFLNNGKAKVFGGFLT